MAAKPLRTIRKRASAERCLRSLGATSAMVTPDRKTAHRFVRGGLWHRCLRKDQLESPEFTGFYLPPGIAVRLRKVRYASDHPCAWALRGSLPQQCHHRLAVWRDGVMSGWGPQATVGVSPHASAGGHYLRELSPLGPLMDHPVLYSQRTRVRWYAPGLDDHCPGG